MTIFMERLQKLMDEHDLTDKDLREQCGGISKNNITNWRKGTKPQVAIVHQLADFFGVSSDYLLGIDDMKQRILDILDQPTPSSAPTQSQLDTLVKYFSLCDEEGRFRIIQLAMNEYDRVAKEKTDSTKEPAV